MKILMINKYLYPRGGAETYLIRLAKLLTDHGHEVIFFSQKDPRNIPNDQEQYFIDQLDFTNIKFSTFLRFPRVIWSFKAQRMVSAMIEREKPDIVHIHNIYHQLSPSVIYAAKRAGLPIVMTVHDFKLIAPNYTLFSDPKYRPHQRPAWWLFAQSIDFTIHRILRTYRRLIDVFIAPSAFVRDRLIEHGFDPDHIVTIIPYFAWPAPVLIQTITLPTDRPYWLYAGRLDESKGIDVLIEAYNLSNKKYDLIIAGAGPFEPTLRAKIAKYDLTEYVHLVGHQTADQLNSLIASCEATVHASRVHETFGLAIAESYTHAKPVIATRSGAFTNLVDETTGLLVSPGDAPAMAAAMDQLSRDSAIIKQLGANALRRYQERWTPEIHYQLIGTLYQRLVDSNQTKSSQKK